jgi:hypothetical protein
MRSSTATAWPSPGRFALALALGFALTLVAAWWRGAELIEAMLPLTHAALGWIDDHFGILVLGVEHNWQDTVIKLKLRLVKVLVLGGRAMQPNPQGWLEVVTPVGNMLQPLVIAPAIAAALPGRFVARLVRFGLAVLLALSFLAIDLPVTLYAVAWDMLAYSMGLNDFSPLLAWNRFMQSGGRLGVALALGVAGWWLERHAIRHRP